MFGLQSTDSKHKEEVGDKECWIAEVAEEVVEEGNQNPKILVGYGPWESSQNVFER